MRPFRLRSARSRDVGGLLAAESEWAKSVDGVAGEGAFFEGSGFGEAEPEGEFTLDGVGGFDGDLLAEDAGGETVECDGALGEGKRAVGANEGFESWLDCEEMGFGQGERGHRASLA